MPRVPVTNSVSKSRGGRISTAPLGMAQQGVARSAATSIIPFMNRDNSMSKIGQGLSAASSVIGGIAADKKNIENSVKDAAEAKAEAASKKLEAERKQQQREMDAANAWEITKQVYQETRSLRDELIKRQGQQASGVNNDFVSGYQSIMEARLKDQNDNVRKMVEKDNWKSFAKWENETHFYEQQQLELFKKNAFESKMSLSIQQAADNLDNSDLFEDDKLDYQEMLEAKAQEARIMGGDPDQVRKQGMDIFHSNVANSLLQNGRAIDADVYLKTNKNEMTKEGYEKSKLDLKPHLINSLATQKANSILLESKGNPFTENEKINAISDAEVRARTKELIDNAKKSKSDQEESILNEVTQAAIANGGVIPPEYNSKLSYAQALKVQDGVAEWKSKQLSNQKKVDSMTYSKRDKELNKFYMQDPEVTAAMSETDVVNLMENIGADDSEQKSIRDTWVKAKNENSKESKAAKTKELIETTSPDIKSALDIVIASNGVAKGTVPFEDIKLRLIEHINAEGITKPSEAIKEANRLMLFAERGSVDTSYDDYAAYASMPGLGAIYNSAKNIYKYFSSNDEEKVRLIDLDRSDLRERPLAENDAMWHDGWGEKASNLEWDAQSGGWIQWSKNLFYDAISGEQMRLVPSEPAERPDGLPSDAQWNMVPDCPTYGWYWSPSKQQGYNAKGFMVIKENYE